MSNLAYKFEEKRRSEMLDGRIVMMAPQRMSHKVVADNLFVIFRRLFKGKPCKPVADGADVNLTEKDRVVPDVMVICNRDIIKTHGIFGAPDLVVEVLSPSTAKNDKGYKKNLYERSGVREYWLVDTVRHSVEVYALHKGKFELEDVYEIVPEEDLAVMDDKERSEVKYEFSPVIFPDMTLTLAEIFEDSDF